MKKLKFKTHNDDIPFGGGHLQGYVIEDYSTLKSIFGKPHEGDGYKVDAEWDILFSCGTHATIYNYKDGRNYNGRKGTPKTKITDWHIGGTSKKSVDLVKLAISQFKTKK